jgi:hypothetical protein
VETITERRGVSPVPNGIALRKVPGGPAAMVGGRLSDIRGQKRSALPTARQTSLGMKDDDRRMMAANDAMILTEVLAVLGVVVIVSLHAAIAFRPERLSVTGGDDLGQHCTACRGGAHHRCNQAVSQSSRNRSKDSKGRDRQNPCAASSCARPHRAVTPMAVSCCR